MKKFFVCFLFLSVGFWPAISAQQLEKYQVWLDSQEVDGKKIIVGWCRNNTSSPVYFNYEAVLKLRGKEPDIQKAQTLALPNITTLLTKAIFTIKDADFEYIHLSLLTKENELLAFDKIDAPPPQQKIVAVVPPPTDPPTHQKDNRSKSNFIELEIDGLILDETRSKLARDFYETFYRNWSTLQIDAHGQTITIREMPARIGIGSVVVVEVNDKTITQLNLRPQTEVIEDLAGQLVGLLENYLTDPNNHSVIEGDDLIGSGIY